MNPEAIRLERRPDGVAVITLDTPDSPVNVLSREFFGEFATHLDAVASDAAIKAVVVASAKRDNFIAGANIKQILAIETAEEAEALVREGHALLDRVAASSKPVVAAIHGAAMGGGLELAMACHYRLATDDPKTVLALPEVQLGLLPGAGGTQRLPRFVGKSKAMDLVLTGRMMDAAEAERCGLVSRVVPLGQLMDEAMAAAEKIAGMSLPATMVAKEAVNRAFETSLAEGIRFERRTFHATFAFADRSEGMAAFAEKRKAAWKHR